MLGRNIPFTAIQTASDEIATNAFNPQGKTVDRVLDEAEQKELVKQIQQIALDDHAYVYMVHTLVNDVTAADVENLAMQGQYDWLNYQMSYK